MKTLSQFFSYKKGQLFVEDVSVLKIVKETQSPVFIYSKTALTHAYRSLANALKPHDFTICFAAKSNSNIAVLQHLRQEGAGADIVSGGELFRAEKAGFESKNILYSGVGKTTKEILEALQYRDEGIYAFIVESIQELQTLNGIGAGLNRKIPIGIRFNPDINAQTHPYISTGLKKNKFGISKKDVLDFTKTIDLYPWIQLRGLSVHIGSQLTQLTPIEQALKSLLATANQIETIAGISLAFLDVGGGLGICYQTEKPPSVEKYCALIKKYLGTPNALGHPIRIMLEPGRSISGNAGILVAETLFKKQNRGKTFVVVNAAMTELIRPALYGSYHEVVPVKEELTKGKKSRVDIVGPVCESADFLAQNRLVSDRLQRGDLLAVLSAGAYGFTMSSHYNSRPKVAEVLVDGSRFQIIRQRETYETLIQGESFLRDPL